MIILGKSRVAAAVAVALGLALTSPAAAQTAEKPGAAKPAPAAPGAAPAKPADAKALFASGEKKFKANDFAGALADFEAANAASPSPEAQRYIALCHDNLQHYQDALAAYEKLIAANPPKMKDQVEEAKKRVDAIKAMPGKVHVETTPPGASVVIDAAQAPYDKVTPVDIELPPGEHTLLVGAEGYDNKTEKVTVPGGGKMTELKVELQKHEAPPPPPPVAAEQPAPPPPPPPPPPEPRSKVPAYVTGAVAIVAAGVGTIFGINALGQSSDFKNKPTSKLADDGENNALVADMMFGIAITFGVTSAVLFLSNDAPTSAKAAPPKSPTVAKKSVTVQGAPYVTKNGGGVGALVSF
jgi:hypothetical protein